MPWWLFSRGVLRQSRFRRPRTGTGLGPEEPRPLTLSATWQPAGCGCRVRLQGRAPAGRGTQAPGAALQAVCSLPLTQTTSTLGSCRINAGYGEPGPSLGRKWSAGHSCSALDTRLSVQAVTTSLLGRSCEARGEGCAPAGHLAWSLRGLACPGTHCKPPPGAVCACGCVCSAQHIPVSRS